MSCAAEQGFKDEDRFEQLGGGWCHPLREREYRMSMWEDGEFSSEPVEFEEPMGLKGNAQRTVGHVGLRLKGNLG